MWSECRYVHCKFKDEQKETETSHFTPTICTCFSFTFWSNFRIPRNSFTCHWIRIASIVLCLDLQSLPTHVSEADQSCGVFWSLAYVLQGKARCTLLQARVFIDMKVRKFEKKKKTLGWLCRISLSVTLFKLLHHGLTRYSGKLGKSDSYCILFDKIKVPSQSKSWKCLKFKSHSEFDLFLTHWVRSKNKSNDSVITIIISGTQNLYEL